MFKFEIKNRVTGDVQFTAELEKDAGSRSLNIGLAVKWALKNDAYLRNADLWNADLRNADLWNADLRNANLRNANLWNANLRNVNLSDADLSDANLRNADLWNANLRNADLWNANLRNANLSDANLSDADLRDADLWNANLRNANLEWAKGNMRHCKTLQLEGWAIAYTSDDLQIGCQRHPIEDWRVFDDDKISSMDSEALEWWRKWKETLLQIIEMSPCEPTRQEDAEKAA